MTSETRGTSTSGVEVTGLTPHGVWLILDDEEHFLPFELFPWFKNAPASAIRRVERPSADHLWWPDVDVDLHVESIVDPRRYPLVAAPRE